jgi:hypothetical protein
LFQLRFRSIIFSMVFARLSSPGSLRQALFAVLLDNEVAGFG